MRFFHSGWLWNPAQTVTHQHPPLGLAWAWAGLGPTSALDFTAALSPHCGLVTVITASHHHCGLVTVIMALSSHCDLVVSLWPCHLTVTLSPHCGLVTVAGALSSHCSLISSLWPWTCLCPSPHCGLVTSAALSLSLGNAAPG